MKVMHAGYAGISGAKEMALIPRCGLAIAGNSGVDLQIGSEQESNS